MQSTLYAWNAAIELSQPTLEELQKHTKLNNISPAFAHTPDLLYGGSNILIAMPLGARVSKLTRVQSVSVILVSDYFQNALVTTVNLLPLQAFGLPLTGAATEFLDRVKGTGIGPLDLATEPGSWEIRYGGSLTFRFTTLQPGGTDPANSKAISLMYNFRVPYRAPRKPYLESLS
jgi:hypothetical protein